MPYISSPFSSFIINQSFIMQNTQITHHIQTALTYRYRAIELLENDINIECWMEPFLQAETKAEALREIAAEEHFDMDDTWSIREFAARLIAHINEKQASDRHERATMLQEMGAEATDEMSMLELFKLWINLPRQ